VKPSLTQEKYEQQGKLGYWGKKNYTSASLKDTSRRSLSFTLILAYNHHVIVLNAFLALALSDDDGGK